MHNTTSGVRNMEMHLIRKNRIKYKVKANKRSMDIYWTCPWTSAPVIATAPCPLVADIRCRSCCVRALILFMTLPIKIVAHSCSAERKWPNRSGNYRQWQMQIYTDICALHCTHTRLSVCDANLSRVLTFKSFKLSTIYWFNFKI